MDKASLTVPAERGTRYAASGSVRFSLRLHSITAVSTAPTLAPPPALVPSPDAGDLVRATINVGAPVYDKG